MNDAQINPLVAHLDLPSHSKILWHPDGQNQVQLVKYTPNVDAYLDQQPSVPQEEKRVFHNSTRTMEAFTLEMKLCRPFRVWWAYHAESKTLNLSRANEMDLMYTPREMFRQAAEIALSDLEPETIQETLKELDEVLDLDPYLAHSLPLAKQRATPLFWIMDAVQQHIVQLRDGQLGADWNAYRVSLGHGVYSGTTGTDLKSMLNAFKHALMHLKEKSRAQ